MPKFLRAEFDILTPILHNTQFISGHYWLRYLDHNTNALGMIVDKRKWDRTEKSDFFAPYSLPAQFHYEQYNGVSRIAPHTIFFFNSRKFFTIDNILLLDILEPTPDQIQDFKDVIRTTREFQVGGKKVNGNGICQYQSANVYDYTCPPPTAGEFIIEFMSDFIPRKKVTSQELVRMVCAKLSPVLPPDYQLTEQSMAEFEKRQYYIKSDMEFHVIPQFFMMHVQTNHPECNPSLAACGMQGLGKLRTAGMGKFRLRNPSISPLAHHGNYTPTVTSFTNEEKQFLKAVLLHDLVPKVGGIDILNDYYTKNKTISGLLLQLHYDWHELRKKTSLKLKKFVQDIETQYGDRTATLYYKLSLADQLAAMLTRVKRVPTFSRYIAGHDFMDKIDLLGLTQSLLPIESPFKLWKRVIRSPELAHLNEALYYGDQPLSTHLLLSMNFGTYLVRDHTAFVLAKVVPQSETRFIQSFWYKIFNITQNNEVFIYVVEEKIPEYPAALVKKVLVKSIRPETSWLRTQ